MKNPPETRRQKFKRLAEARTNRILHDLRLLGNLSGPNYQWDKKDVHKIFNKITKSTEIVRFRFSKGSFTKFTLDAGVPQASGSKGIARRISLSKSSKSAKSLHPPTKNISLDRCDNCFENRPLQAYRGLNLCKRDFRKRKTIYRIKKANLAKGNGHSLVI